MRIPLPKLNASPDFRAGLVLFQTGLYRDAAAKFMEVLQQTPGEADALQFLRLCHRRLGPTPKTAKPTLVWQFPPAQAWERDWIMLLLGDAIGGEVIDNTWSHLADPMIVVDNRLVAEKVPYYRQAFEKGCRVILLHLSDEVFKDDLGAYRYVDGVIRNCRSELLASYRDIFFFPLGYKSGFARDFIPKSAGARKYMWSFAGDPDKSTRAEMIAAMEKIAGGYIHRTSGFGAADSLSTDAYRALMDDTVFVPCPVGWMALETFRAYEALEAGCIPIVERRQGLDYYTELLGPHPIPTVTSWDEAACLIARLKADDVETLRSQCWSWWQDYKSKLGPEMRAFVQRIFA